MKMDSNVLDHNIRTCVLKKLKQIQRINDRKNFLRICTLTSILPLVFRTLPNVQETDLVFTSLSKYTLLFLKKYVSYKKDELDHFLTTLLFSFELCSVYYNYDHDATLVVIKHILKLIQKNMYTMSENLSKKH